MQKYGIIISSGPHNSDNYKDHFTLKVNLRFQLGDLKSNLFV